MNVTSQKILIIIFSILFINNKCNAQIQSVIDSLEKQLQYSNDTTKAKIYNDLTWYYRTISQDKAIEYGNKAINFSKEIKFAKGEAQGYNDLAIIYTDKREYSKSIELLEKALNIRRQLKDEIGIAAIYNKLGIINQEKGNIKEALNYQFAALKIFEKFKIDVAIGNSYNNIAVLMYNNNSNEKSLQYHKMAIAIREKIGDKSGLGASYLNIGNIYLEQLNYQSAYENFLKSTEIMREQGENLFTATALLNLGTACQKLNKFEDALKYVSESYAIRKKAGDKKGIASSALGLSEIEMHFKNYDKAKKLIDEALIFSKEAGLNTERKKAYDILSTYYEQVGNTKQALEYSRRSALLYDTIFTEDNNKQLAEMSTRFEVEKKEGRIKQLASENKIKSLELLKKEQFIYISLLSLVLVIILSFLLYNRFKHKQERLLANELLKQEQLRLRSIIITQEEERKRIAEELHDGIGQMLSAVKMNVASLDVLEEDKEHFEKTLLLIDNSCNELRGISHTMMPSSLSKLGLVPALSEMIENINSAKKLTIDFQNNIENERLGEIIEVNIYRIIQELLQNIFKYAHAKKVSINLQKINNSIHLEIIDDGNGFDAKILKTNPGNGWSNINSRVSVINGNINITSNIGSGTLVRLILNL